MSPDKLFSVVDNAFDPVEFPFRRAVCWQYKDNPVHFLLIRRGEALEIHVQAIGRAGKTQLLCACQSVIKESKTAYPWAKMLIAPVKAQSVYNLCNRLGFDDLGIVTTPDHGKTRLMVIDYGRSSKRYH